MKLDNYRVLYIGDQNLGAAGLKIIKQHCDGDNVFPFYFRKGIDVPSKVRSQILDVADRIGGFDIAISFYSDLVLHDQQLETVRRTENGGRLITNIHPGSNLYPGLGYDTLPLVRGDARHGPAWHFIDNESVDAGPVIDVSLGVLGEDMTYGEHREQNQRLSLGLLENQLEDLVCCDTCESVFDLWCQKVQENRLVWVDPYVNTKNLKRILARFYQVFPDHRVFFQLPYLEEVRSLATQSTEALENEIVKKMLDDVLAGSF